MGARVRDVRALGSRRGNGRFESVLGAAIGQRRWSIAPTNRRFVALCATQRATTSDAATRS